MFRQVAFDLDGERQAGEEVRQQQSEKAVPVQGIAFTGHQTFPPAHSERFVDLRFVEDVFAERTTASPAGAACNSLAERVWRPRSVQRLIRRPPTPNSYNCLELGKVL